MLRSIRDLTKSDYVCEKNGVFNMIFDMLTASAQSETVEINFFVNPNKVIENVSNF